MRIKNLFSLICIVLAATSFVVCALVLSNNPDSFHTKIGIKGAVVGVAFLVLAVVLWRGKEDDVIQQLDYHGVIDDTVAFYKNNPRSIVGSSCVYNGIDGAVCAFARVIVPELRGDLKEGKNCSAFDWIEPVAFLPQYQAIGYNKPFWRDLQMLHDDPDFWVETEKGNDLTQHGLNRVEELKLSWPKNHIYEVTNSNQRGSY